MPGQDDGQLLAAVAGGLVDLAGGLAQHAGHLAQDEIALLVAVGVVDVLEVVEVEQHEAQRLAEALGALDLGGHGLLEAAAIEQAGQLVGHRLALDRLVQADILDRHRRLLGEVVEELALGRAEGAVAPRHRDDARYPRVDVVAAAHRMRECGDAVDGGLARLAGLEHSCLRGAHRLLQPGEAPGQRHLLERRVRVGAHGRPPGVGRRRRRPRS